MCKKFVFTKLYRKMRNNGNGDFLIKPKFLYKVKVQN